MEIITRTIGREPAFARVLAAIDAGRCPALLSGCGAIHRAQAAAALHLETGMPVFAVCPDEMEAERFAADLAAFTGRDVLRLYGRDMVFYHAEGVSRAAEHRRLRTLWALAAGKAPLAVATPDALMLRCMPPETLAALSFALALGGSYDMAALEQKLVLAGYERTDEVQGAGQFAVRGGIMDIFSPAYDQPVRCEFFGDEVDSMGFFDVASQRRTVMTERAVVIPARESPPSAAAGGETGLADALEAYARRLALKKSTPKALLDSVLADEAALRAGRGLAASDRYMDLLFPAADAADYIPAGTLLVLNEPGRADEHAKNWLWQLNEDVTALADAGVIAPGAERFAQDWPAVVQSFGAFPVVMLANFTASSYTLSPRTLETLQAKQLAGYGGSLETAADDIAAYLKADFAVAVLAQDARRARILQEFLAGRGVPCAVAETLASLPPRGACLITVGSVSAGFEYPSLGLAVITEGQLAPASFRSRRKKKAAAKGRRLESFTDLAPGDLVVHESYGIGRFGGIVQRVVDGAERDYIKIAYAGTDVLYIPATQLDAVSKYIGAAEDTPVKLSKLGGEGWEKAKRRAKGAAKELARGLIALQAERNSTPGFAFSPDTPWQREFEDAFGYQETDDQLRAVREIKEDMEKPRPMDRLLCGDVGYGKTEVALRAVMKCVIDGRQAAILVPTTVLAQQHYVTVTRRFADYPVRVAVMSRFQTAKEIRAARDGLADGSVDIVIGTHRILQKDLQFKKLGLLVVDEEQRFGVAHKERLKELARTVDVLTLSATPIPRTLNMALSGVRDMSTIEEPPSDRQPVQTYVLEHDWSVVADAIRREVSRGGQVYYLHNAIDSIARTARRLQELLPGVSIAVAHGRMDEDELGDVMQRLSEGEISVLVCTTIIETGIDIPNVNTLIIEDADRLGLAQLHQIRGRVGRSSRRAFAYFTFRRGKVLSEVAEKRLSAIREFAAFNSGFKIALRDLEIRGAGNILGAEQSGHMMSVGYDMYLKLLEEAVHEEKHDAPSPDRECVADIAVAANIPANYVPSAEQRMDLYRRIAHIRTEEDADDMTDELIDRFGDPPRCVNTLIYIALLRGEAAAAGIAEIAQRAGRLVFTLYDFDMARVSALSADGVYRGRVKVEPGAKPAVSLRLKQGDRPLDAAIGFVRAYKNSVKT